MLGVRLMWMLSVLLLPLPLHPTSLSPSYPAGTGQGVQGCVAEMGMWLGSRFRAGQGSGLQWCGLSSLVMGMWLVAGLHQGLGLPPLGILVGMLRSISPCRSCCHGNCWLK